MIYCKSLSGDKQLMGTDREIRASRGILGGRSAPAGAMAYQLDYSTVIHYLYNAARESSNSLLNQWLNL